MLLKLMYLKEATIQMWHLAQKFLHCWIELALVWRFAETLVEEPQ